MTQRQQNSADAVTTYRDAMARFLTSSLVFMGHTAGYCQVKQNQADRPPR